MPKMYQLAFFLIPEPESQGFKTCPEIYRFYLEFRVFQVTFLEQVVRYSGAEVVDVMESDAARKPLHDLWQFIKRTAFQTCFDEVPILGSLPVNSLKLMLDIKHPYTDRGCDPDHRQLNKKVIFETNCPAQEGNQSGQRQICPVNAVLLPFSE